MIAHAPTLTDRIDALIDWYDKFKPDAGHRIPVYATPRQLAKAIGHMLPTPVPQGYVDPREFNYRGRVVIAIGEWD